MGRVGGVLRSRESTRLLFAELVSEACDEVGHRPSPQATGYVVDLLDARVRTAPPRPPLDPHPDTLAHAMVDALLARGASRWVRLRALGDRALFDAGFFAERVERTVVGVDYYADIGRTAYTRLSAGVEPPALPAGAGNAQPPPVFRELAEHFRDFVTVLAEVGDRARGGRSLDLLRLYERYRSRGAPRDRARLIRHGLVPPRGSGPEPIQ